MAHFKKLHIHKRAAVILAALLTVVLIAAALGGVLIAEALREPGVPVRSVLYYGDIRLGVYDGTVTADALLEDAAGALGADYTVRDILSSRSESTVDAALTYDDCLRALVGAVRDGYMPATQIRIDGKLIGCTASKEDANRAFDAFLAAYKNGSGYDGRACLKDVEFENCIAEKDDVLTSEELRTLLALCAERDDLLLEIDYEKLNDYMSGFEAPTIAPVMVREVCEMRIVDIPYETVIIPDDTLYASQSVIQTKGSAGVKEMRILMTYENGELISERALYEAVTIEPVNEVIRQGTLPDGSATGSFIWTTAEGRVTSRFGYRHIFGSLDFHSGIDVAIPTGTPLYAGDGGKVVFAGRSGNSYGVYVMIDHGNGFETIYAHMSRVTVSEGDLVNKGDLIGYSGATGRVTGPHVHYEFHLNGSAVNPKNYLPDR